MGIMVDLRGNILRLTSLSLIFVSLLMFSCSPRVEFIRSTNQAYRAQEEGTPVAVYHNPADVPLDSEQIGRLKVACAEWMEGCDSASVFRLANLKIREVGGNAFLVTDFEKPSFWNSSKLTLNGAVFLVSDFLSSPDTNLTLTKTKFEVFAEKYLYIGVGVGPETGVSFFLPKLSYHNFQARGSFDTYFGLEGSAWVYESFWCSLNAFYGAKRGALSFDTSLGAWWHPNVRASVGNGLAQSYFHTTLNPKIGIQVRRFWLKAGPSIHLTQNYAKDGEHPPVLNLVKIGGTYFNFELLIKI